MVTSRKWLKQDLNQRLSDSKAHNFSTLTPDKELGSELGFLHLWTLGKCAVFSGRSHKPTRVVTVAFRNVGSYRVL